MSILLYPHSGSGNHGCEALVRSTVKIIGNRFPVCLQSKNPEQDRSYGIDSLCRIIKEESPINVRSFSYLKAHIKYHLLKDKLAFESLTYANLLNEIPQIDYALSFGGDNYCYAKPVYLYTMNKLLRRYHIPTILWGCSIEEKLMDEEMLQDLRGYNKIIARESLTYQMLQRKGFKNVELLPDPAFLLNRIDLPLPPQFKEGNTVGINVSPMIIGFEKNNGITLQNYIELIRYILEETDMHVALIPHVVWPDNDDREPLQVLLEQFKDSDRICLIENHNAEELKGYIARCRFMVAARTHASIAAYSQEVPTLVVGYSVKAKGIAIDLFGSYKDYVVPVQALKDKGELVHTMQSLIQKEAEIRTCLIEKIPLLQGQAKNMWKYLD